MKRSGSGGHITTIVTQATESSQSSTTYTAGNDEVALAKKAKQVDTEVVAMAFPA